MKELEGDTGNDRPIYEYLLGNTGVSYLRYVEKYLVSTRYLTARPGTEYLVLGRYVDMWCTYKWLKSKRYTYFWLFVSK